MADTIQSLVTLSNDSTLQNDVDTIDASEHNTHRTNYRTQVNLHKTTLEEQESNYASSTEPTNKPEGKIWCDTTPDPAIWKGYNDGAGNTTTFVGDDSTQTLTNKTYTNPTFSPAGAKGYLNLGRDLNLKIVNNSTNADHQIDVSFDYLTLYSDTGLACVESQTTAAVYDLSVGLSSGGERAEDATAEGSSSEQGNEWYYVFIYSNGSGTLGAVLSTNTDWANIAAGDKPSGSTYIRRVGAIRNNVGKDLLYTAQIGDYLGIGSLLSIHNIGVLNFTTGMNWVSQNISALVPATAYSIMGEFSSSNTNLCLISGSNIPAASVVGTSPGTAYGGASGQATYYETQIITPQTVYIAMQGTSTGNFGLSACRILI